MTWWRRRGPGARIAITIGVLVLAANVATNIAAAVLGGDPSGPTSSSYATTHDGLSAWATVLREDGRDVTRLRDTIDQAALSSGDTLVIADPDQLLPAELGAVSTFVRGGGRLVVSGSSGAPLAEALVAGLSWSPGGPELATLVHGVADAGSARTLRSRGTGSWSAAGDSIEVFAGDGGALVIAADVGAGRVVALADSGPLTNELLAEADDAALAIAVVGADRPVRFAEAAHGYGRSGGGSIDLPSGWDALLAGLIVATLLWMWSRGRRLGPPVVEEEVPPPPRRAYIDALAATVARAGSPAEAATPLRARARNRLARRAGVDAAVSDDELRVAATRAGVDVELVEGVLAGSLLDLGRAAARLEDA